MLDHAHRLRAEDEGIIAAALLVELRLDAHLADPVEPLLGGILDAIGHQLRGRKIARAFQRTPQRDDAGAAAKDLDDQGLRIDAGIALDDPEFVAVRNALRIRISIRVVSSPALTMFITRTVL